MGLSLEQHLLHYTFDIKNVDLEVLYDKEKSPLSIY